MDNDGLISAASDEVALKVTFIPKSSQLPSAPLAPTGIV